MFKQVTSRANPDIKRIKALAMRKYREEERVFVAEGVRHALEAAEAGWEFDTIVIQSEWLEKPPVQKLLSLLEKQKINRLEVTADIMESLANRDNAQTVLSVIKQRWHTLDDVKSGSWAVLEEIRDPGNLGTIIRTCDATTFDGVILIEKTCDPYSLESIRASMGSFPHVKLVRCTRNEFIEWSKTSGFTLVGTHLKSAKDYREIEYKKPLAIVMGNEQAGMTDTLVDACTAIAKIPMLGKADSLNVSVATAIMLYEAVRN
ncbi:MAG: RNA methyltransferase [Alphaproteobacteria bacterium]|nr:RNA methyltransferase [Alphaproteobacteria bacterium]